VQIGAVVNSVFALLGYSSEVMQVLSGGGSVPDGGRSELGGAQPMRGLFGMTLLAVGVLAASITAAGGNPLGVLIGSVRGAASAHSFDAVSLAAGLAAGLTISWVVRQPWSEIPAMILRAVAGWKRTFALAGIAAACTGILLFY
jgi:hypothetical protein